MKCFQRRGTSTLFVVFEIIIVLLVVAMAFQVSNAFSDSETVAKTNLAHDFKLMVDTLVATPGDAVVQHPLNLSEYSVALSPTQVSVFLDSEPEANWMSRRFSLPEGYTAQGIVTQEETVCLVKKEREIRIVRCGSE